MPENKPKENIDHGKLLISWPIPEFSRHSRGKTWYTWSSLIIIGLLIWAVATANYLFAIITILIAIIFIFQNRRSPGLIECRIMEDGLEMGHSFYAFRDIREFWLIYQPPEVKMLYVEFKGTLRPTLTVPLENQNPLKIREILKKYIDENLEKEEEPTSDTISRSLKI